MSPSPSAPDAFALFAHCLNKVPDPRSKQGTSHPCSTLLAVVLLGLLAKVSTPAEVARWTKRHFSKLSKVLRFGRIKGELKSPCDNTFTRVLKKLSLTDLQHAFADFINALLQDTTLVAAVDGKVAKQMKDENDDPILMLNGVRTVKTASEEFAFFFSHTLELIHQCEQRLLESPGNFKEVERTLSHAFKKGAGLVTAGLGKFNALDGFTNY